MSNFSVSQPIDAQTSLYGVLGNPIRHSLSPLLHNAAFKKLGLNAVYLAFEVQEEMLALAFESMRSMGILGVNLTIPFKEAAVGLVDEIPEDIDRCTGAINTVVNRRGKLYGFNTDGPGLLMALHEELRFKPEGKNILILGAGGAARGAVFALARARAQKIWILNRSIERAHGLAEYAISYFPETEVEVVEHVHELRGEKIHLAINATACGLKGNTDNPLDLRLLEQKVDAYDLVYNPAQTPFLKIAEQLGFSYANGLGMLANQASLSFQLWTGQTDGVREAMFSALKECQF